MSLIGCRGTPASARIEGRIHGLLLSFDIAEPLFQFNFTRRLLLRRLTMLRDEVRKHGILLVSVVLRKQCDIGIRQTV